MTLPGDPPLVTRATTAGIAGLPLRIADMDKYKSHELRVSIRSNQADADAEWMLEHIMCRRNHTAVLRDKVAAYLILIASDAPRGGKMTAKRARARGAARK